MLGQIAGVRPEWDDSFDAWLEKVQGLKAVGLRRILHVVPDEVSLTQTFRTGGLQPLYSGDGDQKTVRRTAFPIHAIPQTASPSKAVTAGIVARDAALRASTYPGPASW